MTFVTHRSSLGCPLIICGWHEYGLLMLKLTHLVDFTCLNLSLVSNDFVTTEVILLLLLTC